MKYAQSVYKLLCKQRGLIYSLHTQWNIDQRKKVGKERKKVGGWGVGGGGGPGSRVP